jgi:hypothetical protein
MRVIQRVQNVFARAFNDALNSNNRFATMESKIAEMAGHLDALGQTVARMSVLSPEEIAGLERMRADNRLLAGWQGREREQLVERANAVLAKLRPMKAVGFQKVRVGSVNDGGYVLLDDFDRVDVVFSFGVEWNADFDVAMAERSKPVFQFDHSIEKPPVEHPRIVWEKKMIAPQASETSESISHLFEIHHVGETRPNALLKMDIEHAEWAVLDATPVADLKKLTQITAEFHGFFHLARAYGSHGARNWQVVGEFWRRARARKQFRRRRKLFWADRPLRARNHLRQPRPVSIRRDERDLPRPARLALLAGDARHPARRLPLLRAADGEQLIVLQLRRTDLP